MQTRHVSGVISPSRYGGEITRGREEVDYTSQHRCLYDRTRHRAGHNVRAYGLTIDRRPLGSPQQGG